MRRWIRQIRALELSGEKNRLGRGSDLGYVGGNLCLWGPERFFSVVRNADCTYSLFGRAKKIYNADVRFSRENRTKMCVIFVRHPHSKPSKPDPRQQAGSLLEKPGAVALTVALHNAENLRRMMQILFCL